MRTIAHRLATVLSAVAVAAPAVGVAGAPSASAASAIPAQAFGMHYLDTGHAYPPVGFGTGRIWDMGVTWDALQPNAPTYTTTCTQTDLLGQCTQSTTSLTSTGFDDNALAHLDSIVQMYNSRHVDPLLVLGMTPSWAANSCNHVDSTGHDWGSRTCAPVDNYGSWGDPWAKYVDFIASRYNGSSGHGRIAYFELWNEPSLMSSYSDSISKLASMQQTAYGILHNYGDLLISPTVAFTNSGWPHAETAGYNWINSFFSQPGGTSFDIVGAHLYPADGAVRAGWGPEWSMNTALAVLKKAMSAHGVGGRQIWDTEHNVGRKPAKTGYGTGVGGAAVIARTYVLATEYHVARTVWYGADDRLWGGTWIENSDFKSLSSAGLGYKTTRALLVGKAALGCSMPKGTAKGVYTCKFGSTSGKKTLLAVWTTAKKVTWKAPRGTKSYYTVTGAHHSSSAGKKFTLSGIPVFVSGSF